MSSVHGTMPTDRPARFAKQLLSHWRDRGEVSDEGDALVQLRPDGKVIRLVPMETALDITVEAPDGEDAQGFGYVVARHLERFGAKDELKVIWDD